MLINFLEGEGGSYLSLGAPLTFWRGRRVLLESGCSLTFLERRGGSYSRIGAH